MRLGRRRSPLHAAAVAIADALGRRGGGSSGVSQRRRRDGPAHDVNEGHPAGQRAHAPAPAEPEGKGEAEAPRREGLERRHVDEVAELEGLAECQNGDEGRLLLDGDLVGRFGRFNGSVWLFSALKTVTKAAKTKR